MIAALYVMPRGPYVGLPDADPWTEDRDARQYAGPHPVVAHPPCKHWGRFRWKAKGDEGGCFRAALRAVRSYGGVLEHPAHSKAWPAFGLTRPLRVRWTPCGEMIVNAAGPLHYADAWVCEVERGSYGHLDPKATWLYAVLPLGVQPPELRWGPSGAPRVVTPSRAGIGTPGRGGLSRNQREATPPEFRDVLLSIARSVRP